MKWNQAIKLLDKGKKIRKDNWPEDSYIHGNDPVMFKNFEGKVGKAAISTKWFKHDMWVEVVEKDDWNIDGEGIMTGGVSFINSYKNEYWYNGDELRKLKAKLLEDAKPVGPYFVKVFKELLDKRFGF